MYIWYIFFFFFTRPLLTSIIERIGDREKGETAFIRWHYIYIYIFIITVEIFRRVGFHRDSSAYIAHGRGQQLLLPPIRFNSDHGICFFFHLVFYRRGRKAYNDLDVRGTKKKTKRNKRRKIKFITAITGLQSQSLFKLYFYDDVCIVVFCKYFFSPFLGAGVRYVCLCTYVFYTLVSVTNLCSQIALVWNNFHSHLLRTKHCKIAIVAFCLVAVH